MKFELSAAGTFRRTAWIPGVYFAEGLPFACATLTSVAIFNTLGMPNDRMTLMTGLLGLPWSLKFLWAPLIERTMSKRTWMLLSQLALAACFVLTAIAGTSSAPQLGLFACFLLTALWSATHDVAADGYYMLALDSHLQAVCSGWRNVCYKAAMITGQGGLTLLAGLLQEKEIPTAKAWSLALLAAALLMLLLFCWHLKVAPRCESQPADPKTEPGFGFAEAWSSFFRRPGAGTVIAFLFFYRFAEAQLSKLTVPFMLADVSAGGLGMTLTRQGLICGGGGAAAFLVGSLLAGIIVGRYGLGKCLWPMAAAMNLPDFIYLALAYVKMPLYCTAAGIMFEQFGYGLGYMAHILVMVQFANSSGKYRTSHFALMTGITILGMTLMGMISGSIHKLMEYLYGTGYAGFFWWVVISTIPSFAAAALVLKVIDRDFGRSQTETGAI